MSSSALDAVLKAGIQIAADGAEFTNMGYSNYKATDSTSNPSLILAAVSQPEYSYLLDSAVKYANDNIPDSVDPKERVELAMDYLLVQIGIEILSMIPGRVSISVDPRLAYDHDGLVRKARKLIHMFEQFNIPRSRILIKIPATYPGILATRTLSSPSNEQPIHTNLTLIFSLTQALACAQANATVISPFIGRVKDWWNTYESKRTGTPNAFVNQPLSEHNGIILVRQIRAAYEMFGYKTQIMAAGFRHPEEVLELVKGGGPDLVTLPPALLHGLRSIRDVRELSLSKEVSSRTTNDAVPSYISGLDSYDPDAENRFEDALEQVAVDKVPEGLKKFAEDTSILEEKLKVQLMLLNMESPPTMPDGWNVKYADVKL